MTLGLFIGRLNPPHIWHIKTIEKSLNENEKTIVLLWSPKENDDKNPLTFLERKNILEKKFKNIEIHEILDNESDLEWIKNIKSILDDKWINNINFYWWDFQNDSAYLVLKEYEKIFSDYRIKYIENTRNESFIEFEWKKYEISATNLRQAVMESNYDLAEKFCDKDMFEDIKKYF